VNGTVCDALCLMFCYGSMLVQVNAFLGYSEILDIPDFDLFFSGSGR
jgi:hypothetical protein